MVSGKWHLSSGKPLCWRKISYPERAIRVFDRAITYMHDCTFEKCNAKGYGNVV